jgi:hypothetical protein
MGRGRKRIEQSETRWRYPRTPHLPGSPGYSAEDLVWGEDRFEGKEIVASIKLDGECTSLYRDGFHARSPDSGYHPSRTWIARLHARVRSEIPPGWRICGENLYARHAIAYRDLPSFFFCYSIWNDENVALSWDETLEWCALLELETVPVFYRGPWPGAHALLERLPAPTWADSHEGFVVRLSERFRYEVFQESVAKWVRSDFLPGTARHWRRSAIEPNALAAAVEGRAP